MTKNGKPGSAMTGGLVSCKNSPPAFGSPLIGTILTDGRQIPLGALVPPKMKVKLIGWVRVSGGGAELVNCSATLSRTSSVDPGVSYCP